MMVSESLRSLGANLSTTVAATMTVLIAMFVLGLVLALGSWMLAWSDYAKDKLLVKVYLCTELTCGRDATEDQIEDVRALLLRMPQVKAEGVRFVSSDEALARMRKRTPELVDNISSNPLPNSFEVEPRRAEEVKEISAAIRAANPPGVDKIRDGEKVADRILDAAAIVSVIVGIAVIVLVVASTVLIANTIRLSIFSRRREIEVMKLVGATNWFVRGPFMIEGLLCGLFGSVIAVALLLFGKVGISSFLERYQSNVQALDFVWNAIILIAVGLLLGALGSGVTLRRFLRV